uniref:EF-hand domain-containing protein n=1 Tax=Spongospora subterranea TaxID=70186 RepID=A0A0H5R9F5_9EUKA|eukprot:CRZ05047.1 hypothetical protein [Spongospora subterranea]
MGVYRIRLTPTRRKSPSLSQGRDRLGNLFAKLDIVQPAQSTKLAGFVNRQKQRRNTLLNSDINADTTPRTLLDQRITFLRSIIVRILLCLDRVGLDRIKLEFENQATHELTIVQFVSFIIRMIDESGGDIFSDLHVDKIKIAQALAELFDSMDLNGSHTIEFSEFLETCIHWGLSSGGGIESRQVLNDPIPSFSLGPSSRIGQRAAKMQLSYIETIDQVLVFERTGRRIMLMDPDHLRVCRTVSVPTRKITAIEYIPCDSRGVVKKLMAVAAGRNITLWEGLLTGRFAWHLEIVTVAPISSLKWIMHCSLLVGAGSNGTLFAWNLDGSLIRQITGHSCSITVLCIVPDSDQILSGSTDRSVRLQSLTRRRIHGRTYTGHNGAIVCLAVNNECNEFVSGSNIGEIFVWSLTDSHMLHQVSGHYRSIAFMAYVLGSAEFISGDESGKFFVWDTRLSFSHIQTIDIDHIGCNFFGSTICLKRDTRLLIPSDLDILSWDQKTQSKLMRRKREVINQDEFLIFGAYVDHACVFITATSKTVRFWNALTGCLKEQYDNLMDDYEISTICLDTTERKMIVGDCTGRIHIFNAISGGIMKKLDRHHGEILGLQYVVLPSKERLVISLGRDGRVKVHDEHNLRQCPIRLDQDLIRMGLSDPHLLTATSDLAMMAVADPSGRILVWDLQLGKINHNLKGYGGVSCLEFMSPYSLLAIANGTRSVHILELRPGVLAGRCLVTISNEDCDVITCRFSRRDLIIYTGDSGGHVAGYNVRGIMDSNNIGLIQENNKQDRAHEQMKAMMRLKTIKDVINQARETAIYGLPRPVWFKALDKAVVSLGIISDPESLCVRSFGPHLTVLSTSGSSLGIVGTFDICRRSIQKFQWLFRVNTEKRLRQANIVADQVLQSLAADDQNKIESDIKARCTAPAPLNMERTDCRRGNRNIEKPVFITQKFSKAFECDPDPIIPSSEERSARRRAKKGSGKSQKMFVQSLGDTSTEEPVPMRSNSPSAVKYPLSISRTISCSSLRKNPLSSVNPTKFLSKSSSSNMIRNI